MKHLLKPAVAATALAVAAFSGTAAAAPLDELYFTQSAGWINPTDPDPETGYYGGGAFAMQDAAVSNCPGSTGPTGTSAGMIWGFGTFATGSSICVQGFDSDSTPTNDGAWGVGEEWFITELIQENNVLSGGYPDPTWIADVLADFIVYSDAIGGDVLIDDSGSKTRLTFNETLNVGTWDNCDPTDPYNVADPITGAGPCADVYKVALTDFEPIFADLDGYRYTISFGIAPGPVTTGLDIPADPNDILGQTIVQPEGSDLAVYTPEIAPGYSRLYVTASWSVRELSVPEPSVLAVFGAGLLGLTLASRRRRKQRG